MNGDLALRTADRMSRRRRGLAGLVATVSLAALAVVTSCQTSSTPARVSRPMARPPAMDRGPDLRVRLLRGVDRIELGGPALLTFTPESRPSQAASLESPIVVTLSEGGFVVEQAGGPLRTFDRSAALRIERGDSGAIVLNGAPYPGRLSLTPDSAAPGSVFDVIEDVALEDYLPGVIAKELYSTWSPAAFEAQAVAARSYALHERGRQRSRGSRYDIESGEMDQVYAGVTGNDRATQAVRATRGLVLTWGGSVLRAYYSSTCGGRAGAAADTWPTGPGYEFNLAAPIQAHIRPCACEFSPLSTWTVTRSQEEAARRLAAFGKDQGMALRTLTDVERIEASRWNAAGRPAVYRLYDRQGRWWEATAEQLRLGLNHAGASGLPQPGRADRVNSGDLEARVEAGTVAIAGRGFGHGVGMCQYGAEGLARKGMACKEILDRFYPEAALERAY